MITANDLQTKSAPPCSIDELKRQWKDDPIWDIETTEGFEEHRAELLEYRTQVEIERVEQYRKPIEELAKYLSCTFELAEYISWIQDDQMDKLKARVKVLEDQIAECLSGRTRKT